MADGTKIEWADATLNYANGCSVLSPGCTNCYAMKLAGTRLRHHPSREGLTQDSKAGPVWTGEVRVHDKALQQALAWKRGRRIFWNAHGDLFHENVPDEAIDRLFAVCALTPQHTHMILTKRSARMRKYLSRPGVQVRIGLEALGLVMVSKAENPRSQLGSGVLIASSDINPGALVIWPLPNVWLGVSVEDQQRADERIPDLLATPAAVRFISAEPLLGPVNLEAWLAPGTFCQGCDDGEGYGNRCGRSDIPRDEQCPWNRAVQDVVEHGPYSNDGEPASITSEVRKLDWVIAGGESGPKARPMHPNWARSLRDQCQAAGVPFLFKQWGEWAPVCEVPDTEDMERALFRPRLPQHQPEGPRRCKVDQLVLQSSGRIFPMDEWSQTYGEDPAKGDFAYSAGTGAMQMMRIGKKNAGRTLDGCEWTELPS